MSFGYETPSVYFSPEHPQGVVRLVIESAIRDICVQKFAALVLGSVYVKLRNRIHIGQLLTRSIRLEALQMLNYADSILRSFTKIRLVG